MQARGACLDLTSNDAPFTSRILGAPITSAPVSVANGPRRRFVSLFLSLLPSPDLYFPPVSLLGPFAAASRHQYYTLRQRYTEYDYRRSPTFSYTIPARSQGSPDRWHLATAIQGHTPPRSRYAHFLLHASLGMHGDVETDSRERALYGGRLHCIPSLLDKG